MTTRIMSWFINLFCSKTPSITVKDRIKLLVNYTNRIVDDSFSTSSPNNLYSTKRIVIRLTSDLLRTIEVGKRLSLYSLESCHVNQLRSKTWNDQTLIFVINYGAIQKEIKNSFPCNQKTRIPRTGNQGIPITRKNCRHTTTPRLIWKYRSMLT